MVDILQTYISISNSSNWNCWYTRPWETEYTLLVFDNMAANILTLLLIRGLSVALSLNFVGEGDCHYVDQERGQKWPHVTSRARPSKAILLPDSLGTLAFGDLIHQVRSPSGWWEGHMLWWPSWLSPCFILPSLASDISIEILLEVNPPTLVF